MSVTSSAVKYLAPLPSSTSTEENAGGTMVDNNVLDGTGVGYES